MEENGNKLDNLKHPEPLPSVSDPLIKYDHRLSNSTTNNGSGYINANGHNKGNYDANDSHSKGKSSTCLAGNSGTCLTRRLKIYKNVFVLSFSFFLLFSAFQGLVNLQTSIHSDGLDNESSYQNASNKNQGGLGAYTMCAMYLALAVSSILLPQIFIDRLTLKWTIVLCILLYTGYIFANLRPSWITLIPAAICLGLAGAPLWTAQCTYIAQLGRFLAQVIINQRSKRAHVEAVRSGRDSDRYNLKLLTNKDTRKRNRQMSYDSNRESLNSDNTNIEEGREVQYGKMKEIDRDDDDINNVSTITNDNDESHTMHKNKSIKRKMVKKLTEKTIPHLLGIFFCFFQGGQIFGNIISSLTLQSNVKDIFLFPKPIPLNTNYQWHSKNTKSLQNVHRLYEYLAQRQYCGGKHCPLTDSNIIEYIRKDKNYSGIYGQDVLSVHNSKTGLVKLKHREIIISKINMLCYVYAIMSMSAALMVALFLDPISIPSLASLIPVSTINEASDRTDTLHRTILNPFKKSDKILSHKLLNDTLSPALSPSIHKESEMFNFNIAKTKNIKCCKANYLYEIGSTFRQMKNNIQILLIPLTIYMGLEQGFVAADFTRAFVSCYFGLRFVGLVMSFYGVIDALSSIMGGSINNLFPRYLIFVLIYFTHISCLPVMYFYPNFGDKFMHVLFIAGLWAIGDGVLQPQLNGLYGTLFNKRKETSAYANCRLWEAVGFLISFGLHEKLCIKYKFIILGCVLTIGMICYGLIEYILFRRRRQSSH
ncbi:unnamed protein product [Gordionus sp. m RMFG-2023]